MWFECTYEGDTVDEINKFLTQHSQPVLEDIFSIVRRVQIGKENVQ